MFVEIRPEARRQRRRGNSGRARKESAGIRPEALGHSQAL
jgi:hypothetical protein